AVHLRPDRDALLLAAAAPRHPSRCVLPRRGRPVALRGAHAHDDLRRGARLRAGLQHARLPPAAPRDPRRLPPPQLRLDERWLGSVVGWRGRGERGAELREACAARQRRPDLGAAAAVRGARPPHGSARPRRRAARPRGRDLRRLHGARSGCASHRAGLARSGRLRRDGGDGRAPRRGRVNSLVESLRYARDPYGHPRRLAARSGAVFTLPLVTGPVTILGHPEGARAVFTAPPETFAIWAREQIVPVFGAGSIFVATGEAHRRQRRAVVTALA